MAGLTREQIEQRLTQIMLAINDLNKDLQDTFGERAFVFLDGFGNIQAIKEEDGFWDVKGTVNGNARTL